MSEEKQCQCAEVQEEELYPRLEEAINQHKGKGEDLIMVLHKAQRELGIKVGGTTEDRRYSLDVVRCIGACGLAPAMLVNEDVYGRVKSPHLVDILKKYE